MADYDVLISYSRKDIEKVHQIVEQLTRHGLRVWFDQNDIKHGDDWQRRVEEGISESGCILYVGSPNCNRSNHTRDELNFALKHNKKVFIAFIEGNPNTDLPLVAVRFHYANLTRDDRAAVMRRLIADIQSYLQETAPQTRRQAQAGQGGGDATAIAAHPDSALILHPLLNRSYLDFLSMRLVQQTLDAAIQSLPDGSLQGRASVLRIRGQELYIAAATDHFTEKQLRDTFRKGQGIPGMIWDDHSRDVSIIHPSELGPAVIQSWGFDSERERRTWQFKTVIAAPMFSVEPRQFSGLLMIEMPDFFQADELRDTLEVVRGLRATLHKVIGHSRMLTYRHYRNLNSLIHVARLIPPPNVSVRSALYVPNASQTHLFMLLGSEHFAHDSDSIREAGYLHPLGRGIIGGAWSTGTVRKDDWSDKPRRYLSRNFGLPDDWIHNIGSIIALPVRNHHQEVAAVLALDSPHAMRHSDLSDRATQYHLHLLTETVGRIMQDDDGSPSPL
jgi:hypothetical protein